MPVGGGIIRFGGGGGPSRSLGGGGPLGSIQQLLAQFQQQQDAAKQANLSRYGEIKGGYEERRKRALADLARLSDQRASDIRQRFQGQQSQAQQSLVSRGLTGSTIAPTISAGIAREEQGALNQLADQQIQRQIGLDTGLEQDRLAFMERRTDEGPSSAMLLDLARRFGSGFGGGGGGFSTKKRRKITGPTMGFGFSGFGSAGERGMVSPTQRTR